MTSTHSILTIYSMTMIALPSVEAVARPNIEEIERLMLLRGFTRRERRGQEWARVPDWANLARDAGLSPGAGYKLRDGHSSPTLRTLSAVARALGAMTRDIIDEED